MNYDYLIPVKIPKNLVPYSDVLMCFFCDAKSKTSASKNEAAQRTPCLGSFQTHHLQSNAILLSTAVPPHPRWGRCRTKEAKDSAPAPSNPTQVKKEGWPLWARHQEQMFSGDQEVLICLTLPQLNSFNLINLIRLYWQMLRATASWRFGLSRKILSENTGTKS